MPEPFGRREFDLFTPDKVGEADYDGPRLALKRKLKAWGDLAQSMIKEQHGLTLKVQTSLHRPYKHNRYRVDSQRVLLTATAGQKAGLKSLLGDAFKEDVASGVVQMTLSLTISRREIETALRVHPGAWWDGVAWEKALAADPARLSSLLTGLPEDFVLVIHSDSRSHDCATLEPAVLGRVLRAYRPAEHWIAVKRLYPREAMIEGMEDQEFLLPQDLVELTPLYMLLKEHSMDG